MPIDPAIPLQVQHMRQPDLGAMLAQKQNMMLQKRAADETSAMNAFVMDRARASEGRTQAQFDQERAMTELGVMVKIGDWLEKQPDKAAAYGTAMQYAQRAGLDTSKLPQQYDPAWISEELGLARAMVEKPLEMTEMMKNVAASTPFKPGTPEFRAEMMRRWNEEQSKLVPVTEGGGLGRYSPAGGVEMVIQPNPGDKVAGAPVSAPPPPQRSVNGYTFADFQSLIKQLGPEGAVRAANLSGTPVMVSSPQEANQLPKGTRYVTPDGTVREIR